MIEAILDPSYEIGSPDWIYGPNGVRSSISPRTGSWSGRVVRTGSPGFPGFAFGRISQESIVLTPGAVHPVSLFVNGSNRGGTNLSVEVDPGSGSFSLLGVLTSAAGGYELWEPGSFVAAGALGRFRYTAAGTSGANGSWFVDDVSLLRPGAAVARSCWDAHEGLRLVLAGINGGAVYHTDLQGRAYGRLWVPGPDDAMKVPYVCNPFAGDNPQVEDDDTVIRVSWIEMIYGFVSEYMGPGLPGLSARDAMRLREDIWKAVKMNPTLGGKAQSVELVSGGGGIAGIDDKPYGEVHVPVKLTVYLGTDVLGP